MSPTSPTWYDVLGVRRDASTEEIKHAWREATDRFEPGSASGQFRMYNEAADVLLDPQRRAEYDATLGHGQGRDAETMPGPTAPAGPTDAAPGESTGPVEKPRARGPRLRRPRRERKVRSGARTTAVRASRGAVVLTAVLAVLAVALLVVVAWLGMTVRAEGRVEDARTEAPAAAEQAAKAMLSYDYRTLPADRQRASGYLTADYRKKYLATFRLLEKNKDGSPGVAVQTKTVVSADVMGSGVVDAEEDTARVLVYVNQTSRKEGADPQVFQNRVTMTMVRQGDRWLVDNLKSY